MGDDFKPKPDLSALRIDRNEREKYDGGGRRLKTILWIAIPLILIIVFAIYFSRLSASTEVRVATASLLTRAQSQSVLSATGYVVAERKASVASKATGRLEWLGVEEGDTVKKGQIIGRIENDDIIAALDLAKAGLEQARAESTQAALDYARQKELGEKGFISEAVLEASRAGFLGAVAAVKSGLANVKAAEVALENTYIRAPFNGTVLTKHADVGEVVAPFASSANSKASLVDLADMRSLEVEADVSEANIQRVSVNQPCEIILDAYPDMHYRGFVKKIVPTADRSRATVLTKVSFSEIDSRVLPEMSARINFFEAQSPNNDSADSTLAIPNSALVMKGDRYFVFIISNDRAQQTAITIGRKFGTITEITGGLRAGTKVIVSPPSDFRDGEKVKIVQ
jgi:HlyD family secretion protein